MAEQLRCEVETDSDVITVNPTGSLTLSTVAGLRAVLNKALAEGPVAIIVNLSDFAVEDESCLTLFPAVAKQATIDSQTSLLLSAASAAIARWIRAHGFDLHVALYPTVEDAALQAHSRPVDPRERRRLRPSLDSPSQARDFVEETCARWPVSATVVETLKLIATELVANAVTHARTPMDVVVRRSRQHIHLGVIDGERRFAVLRGPESTRSPSGRGLMLVEAFSDYWGCTATATGKSTWATVRYVGAPA